MKLFNKLKAIHHQMLEARKDERPNSPKELKGLSKEFSFTVGMFNGSLAEGRKNNVSN